MICEICNYNNDDKHNFSRHICRKKTDFKCNGCLKYYKSKQTLNIHLTTCKNLTKNDENEKTQEKQEKMNDKIELLSKQIEELKNIINNKSTTNNKNTTNINNCNNNNNNINITIVLPHKKPDISHLTDADYYNILGRNLNAIPKIIEKIHFNDNNPQNHNIYISNIKNKYAMLYNGSEWSLQNRDETIHNLIIDNETRLEDWLSQEDILEKYPTAMARFEKYLSLKEKDENLDKIKEEILLLLYNNRNMINGK